MHEFAIVQSLLDELQQRVAPGDQVQAIRLQCSSDFSQDSLRELFAALSKGTALENALLTVEIASRIMVCPCGHRQVITPDDLVGHIFVCPFCGQVNEVSHGDDLRVIEMTVKEKVRRQGAYG